jgi:predicted nucleic acid-binding protein
LAQARSGQVAAVLADDPALTIWWASPVECAGAVARFARNGGQSVAARSAARLLREILERATQVLPTDEVRLRAARIVHTHALRAADALQLSAALTWRADHSAGRGFVCMDERLSAAAYREGFNVLPWPEQIHEP